MRPRYMTRIRSESEKISSMSAEMTKTARPAFAHLDENAVDRLDRADVDAARRLFGDHDPRRRVNSRASWTFC